MISIRWSGYGIAVIFIVIACLGIGFILEPILLRDISGLYDYLRETFEVGNPRWTIAIPLGLLLASIAIWIFGRLLSQYETHTLYGIPVKAWPYIVFFINVIMIILMSKLKLLGPAVPIFGAGLGLYWVRRELGQRQFSKTPETTGAALGSNGEMLWLSDARGLAYMSNRPLVNVRYSGPLKHSSRVNDVSVAPDNRMVVTACNDRTARLWHVSGEASHVFKHRSVVNCVVFSSDGRRVLTGCADGTAHLWDVSSGESFQSIDLQSGTVNGIALSLDGKLAAIGTSDGAAWLWEPASNEPAVKFASEGGSVNGVAISPDGKQIVAGSADGNARLWDVESRELKLTIKAHDGAVTKVAFSPLGKVMLTGGVDRQVIVWDANSGQQQRYVREDGPIVGLGFSKDGTRAIAASALHHSILKFQS